MTVVVVWAHIASKTGCLQTLVAPAGVVVGMGVMMVGGDKVAVVVVVEGERGSGDIMEVDSHVGSDVNCTLGIGTEFEIITKMECDTRGWQ